MSILGKAVEFLASDAIVDALDVPIKALDKASKKMDAKAKESHKKLFEKPEGTGVLVINQKLYTFKDKFNVFDENENVKYTVKGELASMKHHTHVYDVSGKEVGFVKEKLISVRSPLSFEAHPVDFVIEANGKKLGKVKSRFALGKRKFEVDFNGWTIEGNVMGWKYKIMDGKKEIANISQKLLYMGDTYVLNFQNPDDELIVLLLVLAMDAATAPKRSEELKDTVHKRSHYWL